MQTPEQIAAQIESGIYSDDDNYLLTREEMREHLIAAIEADRAQPNYELGVDLPSGLRIMVWVGTSDADGSALVQVDTANAEGNVRIFVNDSEPIFDENPETGKYEDMAPENEEVGDKEDDGYAP